MQCDPNLVFTFDIRIAAAPGAVNWGSPLPSTLTILEDLVRLRG